MARVLAIHAHPDDVEILAGGTLALLAERGHEITIATFTPGDCGSRELGPEEIAAVRRREAANAAARIGARIPLPGIPRPLRSSTTTPSRRRVTEALRQARPDIDPHRLARRLPLRSRSRQRARARRLLRRADPELPRRRRAARRHPASLLHGPDRRPSTATTAFVRPDFIVDVSATFDRKREMLAEHASQREWLRRHHGVDEYLDAMERWTRGLRRARRRRLWRRLPPIPRARLPAVAAVAGTHRSSRNCHRPSLNSAVSSDHVPNFDAICPPSTNSVAPVTYDAMSDARNRHACATSSGVPPRPSGPTATSPFRGDRPARCE